MATLARVWEENFELSEARTLEHRPALAQEAIASDTASIAPVEESWESTGQPRPEELYVDAGYTSGPELVRAQGDGRQIMGPMAHPPSKESRMASDAFDVSVVERETICPASHTSTNCSRLKVQGTSAVTFRFECNSFLYVSCPMGALCLRKGQSHRTLVVGQHHTVP